MRHFLKIGRLVVFPTGPAKKFGRTQGLLADYCGLGPVTLGWLKK